MLQNKDKNIKDSTNMSDTAALFSKTEKVTTALYMVTDCMSDNEPIRHQLRSLAVRLVSLVRSTTLQNQFETHFTTTEIIHGIDETFSFLTMATTLGFISVMNYEILYKEFNKIRQYFVDQQTPVSFSHEDEFGSDKRATSFILSPDFFAEKNSSQSLNAGNSHRDILGNKTMSFIKDSNRHTNLQKGQQITTNRNTISNGQETTSHPEHLNIRNNKIIEILKSKGQSVSITDIASIITDCSEKTIQRSLIYLSDTGVIKRTGEKRWARYSLA